VPDDENVSSQMTRVGIVGLGRMGSRIAQRLTETGFEVTGWDRNAESVRALRDAGIAVAASARAVAEAGEFVLSSVTSWKPTYEGSSSSR
jgi:3-hydroxyisobutyrate dehydrogenase-like beta-hydroxyacid dehydrogenase